MPFFAPVGATPSDTTAALSAPLPRVSDAVRACPAHVAVVLTAWSSMGPIVQRCTDVHLTDNGEDEKKHYETAQGTASQEDTGTETEHEIEDEFADDVRKLRLGVERLTGGQRLDTVCDNLPATEHTLPLRRPVLLLLYGDSGTGKTSLVHTASRMEWLEVVSVDAMHPARGAAGKSEACLWQVFPSVSVGRPVLLFFDELELGALVARLVAKFAQCLNKSVSFSVQAYVVLLIKSAGILRGELSTFNVLFENCNVLPLTIYRIKARLFRPTRGRD